MKFTYAELRALLTHAANAGRIRTLGDLDEGPGIILRHDVDFWLGACRPVAEIEAELGIAASFLVMTTGSMYNAASPQERANVRAIRDLGHEIGLHFYPSAYGAVDDGELNAAFRREVDLLSGILGEPIRSVSIHNPSAHGRYIAFGGYRNAYDPRVFAPDRYLSDSRMRFLADPHAFIDANRGRVAQILLHPEHFSEDGREYPARFEDIVRAFAKEIDREMQVNDTYRRLVKRSAFQRRFLDA